MPAPAGTPGLQYPHPHPIGNAPGYPHLNPPLSAHGTPAPTGVAPPVEINPGTPTRGTPLLRLDLNLPDGPPKDFFEGKFDLGLQVLAAAPSGRLKPGPAPGFGPEEGAKNPPPTSHPPVHEVGRNDPTPGLVIFPAPLGVRQHLISFVYLPKLGLGLGAIRIKVRVKPPGEPAESLPNLRLRSPGLYPEGGVIILDRTHPNPL